MSQLDRFDPLKPLWPSLALLALSGCSFSLINGKGIDKLGKIVREAVLESPVEVQGPPAEKILDWPELLALAGMGIGGIAHRYWYHRRHPNGNGAKP